jgi:ABC-type oligopeptide transport system ATPase subunit
MTSVVSVAGVCKSFASSHASAGGSGTVRALDHVTFNVEPGELFG